MDGGKEKDKKSEMSQDLVLFNEVPWNNVDMQLHFDAFNINQEDAESLLSVQNFSDNGTFLVRLEEHKESLMHDGSQNNLMLSFVYDGRIHHHKKTYNEIFLSIQFLFAILIIQDLLDFGARMPKDSACSRQIIKYLVI